MMHITWVEIIGNLMVCVLFCGFGGRGSFLWHRDGRTEGKSWRPKQSLKRFSFALSHRRAKRGVDTTITRTQTKHHVESQTSLIFSDSVKIQRRRARNRNPLLPVSTAVEAGCTGMLLKLMS